MRRSLLARLALLALIAVPLTACASATTPAAQVTQSSAVTSSSDATMTRSMTAEVMSDEGSAGAMVEPSGSMMEHPESALSTGVSIPAASTAMAEESPVGPTPTGVTITGAGSEFGEILFDSSGQAIYLFDRETTAVPDCYDDCAAAWPPVLTSGSPVAGAGATNDLLGTTPRTDGSTQVTYAGHPLYYYANEGKHQVTCQNVSEFGGLWLVVTPAGQAVR